ncbi:MAG TPA: VOC family protein [Solirubrobacterales bacterium]|jgi:catechol 2,3-dioxygenase-like lactoylglutathione lyase family enzyme
MVERSLPVEVDGLDHLVITVTDPTETERFYTRVLGMRRGVFGPGRVGLAFGQSRINLHRVGEERHPHAREPVAGSADICLVGTLGAVETIERLRALGVEVEEGPVARFGARGAMVSVYLRDPDDNLIEIACYPDR